jgi:hypothetical protein
MILVWKRLYYTRAAKMPATIPPSATTLALLPVLMAAFPVLEGWSAEVTLEEAAEMDATAELKAELWALETAESEDSADDADADATEEAEDKAAESVLYIWALIYRN